MAGTATITPNMNMLVNGCALGIIPMVMKPWMRLSCEVKAARSHAGILDASTLGKIDIRGKDAAEFLNRVYTNAWASLKIGSCRYGLMLKDDGMVMDDGVTTRLGKTTFT